MDKLKAVLRKKAFWVALGGLVTVTGCAAFGLVSWDDVGKAALQLITVIFVGQ